MSFKQSYPLSQRGRWRDPARLYQNGSSRKNETSSDESEINDLSDSTLDGIDLGSSYETSMVNSMMYSDDDFSAKSGISVSSSGGRTKPRGRDPLSFNALPLFTNTDMMQVRQQSQVARVQNVEIINDTGSLCDTARSSIASTIHDNYFKPSRADLVVGNETTAAKSVVADTSIESDSENYIFTDEEYDDGSNLVVKNSIDTSLFSNTIDCDSKFVELHEQDWSSFQQRRGRLLAQQLLETVSNRTQTNTANSSTSSTIADREDCEIESDDNSNGGRRTSFFARTVQSIRKRVSGRKKIFSTSTSPLDKLRTRKSWSSLDDNNRIKVSNRPATPLAPPPVSTSAASTRNFLSDFSSWEACARNTKLLSTLVEDDTEDCSSILEETSFSSETRDDPFRLTQLSSSHINSFDYLEGSEELLGRDEMIVFQNSIEGRRVSSEEVAAILGIQSEGTEILRKARVLCRADTTFGQIDKSEGIKDETLIPMVQVTNDIWLSKYDEYVSRTVSAFYNQLPNVLGQHIAMLLDE
jgi:hypothetical protein